MSFADFESDTISSFMMRSHHRRSVPVLKLKASEKKGQTHNGRRRSSAMDRFERRHPRFGGHA
jgi:hypothetical protein